MSYSDPRSPATASILFMQGFGDHCNSPYHAEQMLMLARMGYDVHGFDHESLGRSDDRANARCFLPRFDDLVVKAPHLRPPAVPAAASY